uniref:Trifunctional enzyme subunit alpha, mitochondrial n=1 Tax=Parastrongyloides trichosuri TaxID=131310 RepID=A0A0N4ZF08_PARTI
MLSRLAGITRTKVSLPVTRGFCSKSVQPAVSYTVKDEIAVIKMDIPDSKQNVLNESLTSGFDKVFEEISNNDSVKGVVIMSGKPSSFVAGADVGMLQKAGSAQAVERLSREGQAQFARLENFKKPIVAAIMGPCMGGGLELALACHYRIAVNNNNTSLALPEVMLGLMPGAGGTQRLPKLVSIVNALDMMLTGKNIKPVKAKKIGLVDMVVQPLGVGVESPEIGTHKYLEEVAIETAKNISSGKLKVERTRPFLERVQNYVLSRRPLIDSVVMRQAKDKVMKQTLGNYPAPLKILDTIRTGLVEGSEAGYDAEAKNFGELSETGASKALIGLFNGSTDAKKNKYGEGRKIDEVSVIGAGLMGAGIANVTIDKGIKTNLLDMNQAGLDRGINQIHTQLNTSVKKKKYNKAEMNIIASKLHPTTDYNAIKNSDVVVEAVFEDMDLKHKIIKQIEAVVGENCVIASNTSALPIAEIAKASKRPENVIGMHYFSPVDKMQLLEIITHEGTSKETIATAAKLGFAQKKLVVVVKDCPGFFVVRCLGPMTAEIFRLLQEGVQPKEVDLMTKQFGFPVGGATLADEVGLDVATHVAEFLTSKLGPRMGGGNTALLRELVDGGHLGKKTSSGIYTYKKEGKKVKKEVNEVAAKIFEKYRQEAPSSVSSKEDRQLRVISRFINEASLCLQEEVIRSPSDGDIASVFGIGFPPFWGGPFRFVDLYGAQKLVGHMERFANAYEAAQFMPCDLLKDYAKSGKKFHKN